jgi:cytochrome c biogenesis protein CcmG, thiol:disulfide interchange protein DsbE
MVVPSGRISRLAAFALFFAAHCVSAGAPAAGPRALLNKPAPDFAVTDLNNQPLRLSSFRGKVVLLNFWATWCAPCETEMPAFTAWQRQYGPEGLQVIGISMDDESAPVRRLANRLKLNYPAAMGDAHLGARYGGVLGLPLTFLIDRDGIIRARFQGNAGLPRIERRMKVLLSQR